MLRISTRRLPHQLIKEPLGLEHDTMSRTRRTVAKGYADYVQFAAYGSVGMATGLLCIFGKDLNAQTVDAKGVVSKNL